MGRNGIAMLSHVVGIGTLKTPRGIFVGIMMLIGCLVPCSTRLVRMGASNVVL